RQQHPEKWQAIQGAVSRPFMTDDFIHALLGLMDIQTAEYDPRKNIFAPEFDTERKRLISGRDYDRELRHEKLDE
ncbi:MAG: transmembrane sulphatase, partial [Selenomonadaceae bacterium]|nr:transmembrane sulphatase [Selenomonadaceae bacterium]